MGRYISWFCLCLMINAVGCSDDHPVQADVGAPDAASSTSDTDLPDNDTGESDTGEPDTGEPDAGEPDAGEPDAGEPDAGPDADNGELPYSEFVTVDPNEPRFLLEGEPFYFAGTNLYWLVQWRTYGNDNVDDALDVCEELGIRVIRIWGFADGSEWTNPDDPAIMQSDAGMYEESAFEALDYVLAEAAERNLKVIIPLVNYWPAYGGMQQYAQWAGGEGYEFFYTTEAARQLYRDYVDFVLTRTNTITGVEYRNDPTIMSWELANEANAYFDEDAVDGILHDWYAEMSAYIRSVDSNHLIATGEEGFDIPEYRDAYSDNYSDDWVFSGDSGTSFTDNTTIDDIDFAGAHLYPDLWSFSDAGPEGQDWIVDHAELANDMGKPFILGEFGYPDRTVYSEWLETAEEHNVAGTLLWELVPESRGAQSDMHVVYPDDEDYVDLFRDHAAFMNAR